MKRLFLVGILAWLLAGNVAAQSPLIPRGPELLAPNSLFANPNPWEFAESRSQILARLLSKPGWEQWHPDKVLGDKGEEVVVSYRSSDGRIALGLFFVPNGLYARTYAYSQQDLDAKAAWDGLLSKLDYNEQAATWLDRQTHTLFSRTYLGATIVIYRAELWMNADRSE